MSIVKSLVPNIRFELPISRLSIFELASFALFIAFVALLLAVLAVVLAVFAVPSTALTLEVKVVVVDSVELTLAVILDKSLSTVLTLVSTPFIFPVASLICVVWLPNVLFILFTVCTVRL